MASTVERLRQTLDFCSDGEVLVVVVSSDFHDRILDDAGGVLDGTRLLQANSVSEVLSGIDEDAVEVSFRTGHPLPVDGLRSLNQQREQLRRKQVVVLRLPVEHAETFAKYAPDVWKWATVLDLTGDEDVRLAAPSPATGTLEENPYAPALDPATTAGAPAYALKDPGLDES